MNFYLTKYGFHEKFIDENPNQNLEIIVVIPCYNEPDLISSLQSIASCHKPNAQVEVIIVLNASEKSSDDILNQNALTKKSFHAWNENFQNHWIKFFLIEVNNLLAKHAGVGLARKIGMDEAVRRFDYLNKDGIIVCFDADSFCEKNYLVEIEKHFQENKKSPGCSIYFEHPTQGTAFDAEIYNGIIQYELHLRYYNQALKFCNLPYAFHTIGSSMAVKSSAYQKQGGMNKRKAGEDFYFLHKIIALGNFTELNTTKVIPSPRISDRVPFGTGRAMSDFVTKQDYTFYTYHVSSFLLIKRFVELIPDFYRNATINMKAFLGDKEFLVMNDFLMQENFWESLNQMKTNTSSEASFKKRFFVWFDAFKVLKLVHFLRDNLYENIPVNQAARELMNLPNENKVSDLDLLIAYRKLERKID